MKAKWLDSGERVAAEALEVEGVDYQALPVDASSYQAPLDTLKAAKGYVTQDVIALSPETDGLDAICAKFADEHLHTEDEVRFVLEGEGVFDIRSRDDRWMEVLVETGDLIVVPASRHHRFRLTEMKTIRCVRLFKDKSGWTPHYRVSAPER